MPHITTTWLQSQRPLAAAPYACFVHIYPTGSKLGQRYFLADSPIIVGRSDDNDIAIQDHAVSRKHARIDPTAEGVFVSDLASTNGTFINDRPIEGTEMLCDG